MEKYLKLGREEGTRFRRTFVSVTYCILDPCSDTIKQSSLNLLFPTYSIKTLLTSNYARYSTLKNHPSFFCQTFVLMLYRNSVDTDT